MDVDEAARLAQAVVFREWVGMIRGGLATVPLLQHMRARLDGSEFGGADRGCMEELVLDHLAAAFDCAPSDLRLDPVPDFVPPGLAD